MEDVGQVSNVSTSAIPKIVQSDFNPSIPVSESSSKKGVPPAMERLSIYRPQKNTSSLYGGFHSHVSTPK